MNESGSAGVLARVNEAAGDGRAPDGRALTPYGNSAYRLATAIKRIRAS
jgi:hypothetical protein